MLKNHLTHAPPPRTSEHAKEDYHKWPIAYSYSDTTFDSTFSTEPAELAPMMGPKYAALPFVYTEAFGGLHMGLYMTCTVERGWKSTSSSAVCSKTCVAVHCKSRRPRRLRVLIVKSRVDKVPTNQAKVLGRGVVRSEAIGYSSFDAAMPLSCLEVVKFIQPVLPAFGTRWPNSTEEGPFNTTHTSTYFGRRCTRRGS